MPPSAKIKGDWTLDPRTGRVNTSAEFEQMIEVVADMIRDGGFDIVHGHIDDLARTILASLSHGYEFTTSLSVKEIKRRKAQG